MEYAHSIIRAEEVPKALVPLMQHAIDTYASETNKVYSIWTQFSAADLNFQPHEKSSTVREIMMHQLLSERRFFADFLGLPEPPLDRVLPAELIPEALAGRFVDLARPRLVSLAGRDQDWWLGRQPFFDVSRERVWIFWRRVLHTSHHRTQLSVCLRLLNKPVPPIYGPTADVSWSGATPTLTVEAASGKSSVADSNPKS